jgi:predicted TIM-barrel fold metal-dependent hydrolase
MLVDFQHHYTPPELMERGEHDSNLRLDANGNPNYRFIPLLADLAAHVRMMDEAGIDGAVLSCGSGFDQQNVATCHLINNRMHQAEQDHPGRFIGLAHVPALNPQEAGSELKRCAVELGFPGVVIASEVQGEPLDAPSLRPFWRSAADLGLYVFIHPPPQLIGWAYMDVDDLWRMLGWEFSLMVATVRLINSGLLDELPSLKIHIAHFGGGIARYLPRIRGLQDREKSGTAQIPRHSRTPRESFDHYLQDRLFYDCAGWSGPDQAAERGSEWVRAGLAELPPTQVVFATDYPQSVRQVDEIVAYVKAVGGLGSGARKILDGANAEKLIPNLKERLVRVQLKAGNGVLQLAGEQGAAISTPVENQSVMQQQQLQPKKDTTNE